MICPVCGTENANSTFCINCGVNLSNGDSGKAPANQQSSYSQPTYQQPAYQRPAYQQPVQQPAIPEQYKPISAWGYFGYQLLFSIPLVGFIMLLVFSFGGSHNINLKNYARSYWCAFLIYLILGILISIVGLLIYAAEYA